MKKLLVTVLIALLPSVAMGQTVGQTKYPAALDSVTDPICPTRPCFDALDTEVIYDDYVDTLGGAIIQVETKTGISSATTADNVPNADEVLAGVADGQTEWMSVSGDVTFNCNDIANTCAAAVADDSHAHTGTSLSGVGVADTTLTAGTGIAFSTDDISFSSTELGTLTWYTGANDTAVLWTWNFLTGTDPVFTFQPGIVNLSAGALQEGGVAILNNDEMDASSELLAIFDDETGSASGTPLIVFNQNPTINGAVLNGVLDAGAATRLEIPHDNDVSTRVTTEGDIAVDTDGEQLVFQIGSTSYEFDMTGYSANLVLKATSAGTFTLQEDVSAGSPTFSSLANPTADSNLAFDDDENATWTTTNDSNDTFFKIVNSDAGLTSGNQYLLELQYSDANNDANASADFINCTDSNSSVFSVANTGIVTATSFVGALTGNVTGVASSATALATPRAIGGVNFDGTAAIVPTTIAVLDTTDTTSYVGLFTDPTGDLLPKTDAGLTYNAGTAALTATTFVGALTGNVTGALTGNADSSTLASTVTVVDSTDATSFVAMFDSATGSLAAKTDGSLLYAADTGVLTTNGLTMGDDEVVTIGGYTLQNDVSGGVDQFLLTTTNTAATATTDPMVQVLVGAATTTNQQVFGIANGTQASNTDIMTIDKEGDLVVAGSITTNASLDPTIALDVSTATDTDWWVGVNSNGTGTNDDSLEFRTAEIPGTGVQLEVQYDGDWLATGDVNVKGGALTVGTAGQDGTLVFYNDLATDRTVTFQPSASQDDDNFTYTLPVNDGESGEVLSTNGVGVLSWTAAGSGDVSSVGPVGATGCIAGACYDGTSDGGQVLLMYDGNSNAVTIDAPDVSGDYTVTLPESAGTLVNCSDAGKTITFSTGGSTDRTYNLADGADVTILTNANVVTVPQGGTGRVTGTTAYSLVATGTTATGAQQTLANGATTEILVGGGASALPVWTTATGSGAPVRATTPTLVTPVIGAATGTSLAVTGNVSAGSVSTTATEDPYVGLSTADNDTDWYVGVNNNANVTDDDSLEFRSSATAGTGNKVAFTTAGGVNTAGNIVSQGSITAVSGVSIGTSQALIGTTAMTIGNGNQTVAINSSDWDIGATGIMTGMGNITSDGNIAGATYGSDSSISDAELLTLDDGATTQVLVGGGAGSAPVWGTDIPTAVTIGTAYIYRAGGTDVADADVADNITITAGSQIASGSPSFTAVLPASVGVDDLGSTDAEWDDLWLGDNSIIHWGAGGETTLTYDAGAADKLTLDDNLAVTGTINGSIGTFSGELTGLVDVNEDADGATIAAADCAGSLYINTTQANIYNLPTASVGLNCCFYASSAHAITVHPYSGDKIIYEATDLTTDNTIDSPATIGSFACFVATTTDIWRVLGHAGTWVDGGED